MKLPRYKGLSGYACTRRDFPTERFLSQYPPKLKYPAIATMPGSFGWNTECIEGFIKMFEDRPHLIEVFLSNGCARRRSKKEESDFAYWLTVSAFDKMLKSKSPEIKKEIHKRMKKIESKVFSLGKANTKFVLTLELEDNMSDAAAEAFVEIVGSMYLDLAICRNPLMGGQSQAGADLIEHHASKLQFGKDNIYNLDGISVDFKDGENFFKKVSVARAREIMVKSTAFATFTWSGLQQRYPKNFNDWADTPGKKEGKCIITDEAIEGHRQILKGL